MKKTLITIAISLTALFAAAQSKPVTLTKMFPCHDNHSNIAKLKRNTIDSLSRKGYTLTGLRVEQTFSKLGHNTQVLTFHKKG